MIRKVSAIAAFSAAALCLAAPAAQAQGILDLGRVILGLPTEQKDPIDYRERPPLVVPPNQQNLRAPVDARAADQRRANWPQDPDVLARRQAAEEARKPVMVDSITGREMAPTRRLTLDEIRAGRVAGAEVPRGNPVPAEPIIDARGPINVFGGLATLREMDNRDRAEGRNSNNLSRVEPPREFLTDPPTGLRRPADNAAFRATREGQVGPRPDPSPFDIYREGPNTR
jgi:hypothetical protein